MNLVSAFTNRLDDGVNYLDFLKTLDKTPSLMGVGDTGNQDDAGPHLVNAMREQIAQRI